MFWAYSSQHSPAASPMLFCHAAFAGTSTLPEVPSSRNHSRQMWWQRRSVLLMCSYLLCSMQVLKRCKTIRKSGRSSSFSSVPRIVDRIYARVRMDGQTLPCFLFAFVRLKVTCKSLSLVICKQMFYCSSKGHGCRPPSRWHWTHLPFPTAAGPRAQRCALVAPVVIVIFPGLSRASVCLSWLCRSATPPVSCGPQSALRVLITPQFVRRLLLQAAASTLARIA